MAQQLPVVITLRIPDGIAKPQRIECRSNCNKYSFAYCSRSLCIQCIVYSGIQKWGCRKRQPGAYATCYTWILKTLTKGCIEFGLYNDSGNECWFACFDDDVFCIEIERYLMLHYRNVMCFICIGIPRCLNHYSITHCIWTINGSEAASIHFANIWLNRLRYVRITAGNYGVLWSNSYHPESRLITGLIIIGFIIKP